MKIYAEKNVDKFSICTILVKQSEVQKDEWKEKREKDITGRELQQENDL